MAYTLKEFAAMLERDKLINQRRLYELADGDVNNDPYYDALGVEVERHPIYTPRARRG